MDKRIQIEIDEDLKKASDKLFKKLGLNTSTTIKIFLSMSVAKGGFPFEVKLPNASLLQALIERTVSSTLVRLGIYFKFTVYILRRDCFIQEPQKERADLKNSPRQLPL